MQKTGLLKRAYKGSRAYFKTISTSQSQPPHHFRLLVATDASLPVDVCSARGEIRSGFGREDDKVGESR